MSADVKTSIPATEIATGAGEAPPAPTLPPEADAATGAPQEREESDIYVERIDFADAKGTTDEFQAAADRRRAVRMVIRFGSNAIEVRLTRGKARSLAAMLAEAAGDAFLRTNASARKDGKLPLDQISDFG